MLKTLPLCGLHRHKKMKFFGGRKLIKIEAAGRSEGRDRDRLKGNGETESFKRPELAANRQKFKITTTTDFFPTFFPKKILLMILLL